jgi:hypothetical protein
MRSCCPGTQTRIADRGTPVPLHLLSRAQENPATSRRNILTFSRSYPISSGSSANPCPRGPLLWRLACSAHAKTLQDLFSLIDHYAPHWSKRRTHASLNLHATLIVSCRPPRLRSYAGRAATGGHGEGSQGRPGRLWRNPLHLRGTGWVFAGGTNPLSAMMARYSMTSGATTLSMTKG